MREPLRDGDAPRLGAAVAGLAGQIAAMSRQSHEIEARLAALRRASGGPVGPGRPVVHGPRVTVSRSSGMAGAATGERQRAHVEDLVHRYVARTRTSKEIAQRYRGVLADSRAVVGFRTATKEMAYPIAGRRAHGPHLEDLDGNRYVDITMGFGVLLFGHEPFFVTEAVREHLSRGIRLGPRSVETGEAAVLLSELTGLPRVAFATSGTEANSAAIRLARAATGRRRIVTFHGSYHGHADNVLGRSVGTGAGRQTVPVSTGIPDSAVSDLVVLDYGTPESLAAIEAMGRDLAAVVVEPVQSRHPALQPAGFVRSLREVTSRHGVVLMFDEMLTGFRPHPRGAQGFFGVTPDLATYGKVLGGGFPIGAIAGRADIMDGVDGGFWRYGDDSYPQRETTFFGGTYLQHPVSMAAARAVLEHLRTHSPHLQERLNARTDELARTLNAFFAEEEFPVRVEHFGSMFRFAHRADLELLYHHLILRGVLVWEWRNFFLSTAHTDADIEFVIDAVTGSLRELRAAGFFPRPPRGAPVPTAAAAAPAGVAPVVAPPVVAAPADPAPVVSARSAVAATTGPDRPDGGPSTGSCAPRGPAAAGPRPGPDFSVCYFGDYPAATAPAEKYRSIIDTARFADEHGFHALWMPERHFHSFGGLFPNPAVLAAALARETRRIRLHAGSVVLPLHDPVRVAEEWSMVDNLSGGRIGIGCAPGWHARDFVFFPEHFGRHRDLMYAHLAELRRLWRGEPVLRRGGDGEDVEVRLFPRPVQQTPPMFAAIVGRRESYELAARHDLGVITNLMTQSVEQLAENVAHYRKTRAEHGLDAEAGRVVVLLHTYLGEDAERTRAEAFRPLAAYLRASLSLFGQVATSLGVGVDVDGAAEEDLDYVFRRAYGRYCDARALIGSVEDSTRTVDAVRDAGADEIAALVDFGVTPQQLRRGLSHLDRLRRHYHADADAGPNPARGPARPSIPPAPAGPRRAEAVAAIRPASAPPADEEPVDVAPLAPGQQRIWFVERLVPGGTAYNEPTAIRLEGPLDVPRLRAALDQLVARHPALRTVFRQMDGEPRQVVFARRAADFAVEDCAGQSEDDAVRHAMRAESRRRFDLEAGPLFFARLLRWSDTRHVLVLSLHHLVVDAASATVLTRDLSAFYRARTRGGTADLPPLPRGYAQFCRDELAALDGPKAATDLAYWLDRLGGELPVLRLPTDRPRPAVPTSHGRSTRRALDAGLSAQVRRFSRDHGVTLFMTLLTVFAVTLRRFSGQDDLVIGTPVSNRPKGAEDVVGFFLNTLALRLDLAGDPSFAELLRRTRTTALDAYDHADVPFETVVRAVRPHRDAGRNPLFAALVDFENDGAFRLDLPDVRATPLDAGADRAVADLSLYLTDRHDGIGCRLEYHTDLFDAATAQRFLSFFTAVLAAAVRAADAPLSRLVGVVQRGAAEPVAAVPDGGPVPEHWAVGPVRDRPAQCLHEAVERHATSTPEAVAVIAGETALTYRELDARADRLAGRLRTAGVGRDAVVALWLPRSAPLIVAMLAVLKAGAAYLPLDPSLGPQRVGLVVCDSAARVMLTADRDGLPALPDGVTVLPVDERPDDAPDDAPAADAPAVVASDARCYVIYTSGSTGRPKGVAVTHANVLNLCRWQHYTFGLTAADRSGVVCGQSFDASVLETWGALTAGACVVVADEHTRLDTAALASWYARTGVTFSILPTALGEELLGLPTHRQPPLRHLLLGGDVLRVRPRPGLPYEVVNVYGPTETTVLVTAERVADAASGDGPIPIGRPIDNTRLRVLDPVGRPVAVGETGELYIGGAGVAQGYLHRPDLTRERFVPDPFGAPGDRLYRTGDLVRWTVTGALEFRGRRDDQVKIRGFRVEPGDVTQALRGLDLVSDAVVVARRDHGGEAVLAGYVVPAPGVAPDGLAARLSRALRADLPDHLMPRAWVVLDRLPRNGNGKIDRSALPEPAAPSDGDAAAPADELEDRLRALWSAELGREPDQIGVTTSFFDLGGHSLSAVRLLNRVREALGVDYPVLRFFQAPTARAMAAAVRETTGTGPSHDAGRVRGTL
jgi:iturin family lipopeptide synthetase A